eukprot:5608343-Pyramimonas_sp.AAC.1
MPQECPAFHCLRASGAIRAHILGTFATELSARAAGSIPVPPWAGWEAPDKLLNAVAVVPPWARHQLAGVCGQRAANAQ